MFCLMGFAFLGLDGAADTSVLCACYYCCIALRVSRLVSLRIFSAGAYTLPHLTRSCRKLRCFGRGPAPTHLREKRPPSR